MTLNENISELVMIAFIVLVCVSGCCSCVYIENKYMIENKKIECDCCKDK